MDKKDPLRLKNQLCFPLYACARQVVNAYRPFLDKIGLTYTQYIAMMVMWEENTISIKELGPRRSTCPDGEARPKGLRRDCAWCP